MNSPFLSCPRLPSFASPLLKSRAPAEPGLILQQSWRTEPEPAFMPGRVEIGWVPEGFVIEAELMDRDIFNPVRAFNEPAFLQGDVFEIFMRPEGREAYHEFHITPHNQLFQYRIPSAEAFRARRQEGIQTSWILSSPILESHTRRNEMDGFWQLSVNIKVKKWGFPSLRTNDRWNFSFCRYDYSKNREKPCLSSTSRFKKLDFHDQDCWDTFVLS